MAITVIGAVIIGASSLLALNSTAQLIGTACGVVVMTIGHCTFLVLQRIDGLIATLAEKSVSTQNQSSPSEE